MNQSDDTILSKTMSRLTIEDIKTDLKRSHESPDSVTGCNGVQCTFYTSIMEFYWK